MELMIFLAVAGSVTFFMISIYNRLVALRQNRHQSFADIDVQLKQRFDLVPQLVETVKGYAAHEKKVFENVTAARAGVKASKNIDQRVEAENVLTRAMMGLYAVAENYPDLKANANFQQLMAELSDIENKLAAARRFFNNAVNEYNTGREQFPAVLLAGAFGFGPRTFFDLGENRAAAEVAPKVSFN